MALPKACGFGDVGSAIKDSSITYVWPLGALGTTNLGPMAATPCPTTRRLVVNADDFGRSSSINQAVARAHREGILTTASLMVNEPGFAEAVALARDNPRLGVGLHLSLASCPIAAGFRYFFRPSLRPQLKTDIRAQLHKFLASGLKLDHVNSHHHLHMHPTVLGILLQQLREMRASGNDAHFVHADLVHQDAIKRLVEGIITLHARVDILVNNAAIYPYGAY